MDRCNRKSIRLFQCDECKEMALAWEELAESWKGHDTGLIAEVDCSEELELCEEYGIQVFPTLLYGDSMYTEPYNGEHTFEEMSDFASAHISKLECSVPYLFACDDAERELIADLQAKSREELEDMEAQVKESLEQLRADYDKGMEEITAQYEQLTHAYNENVEEIRSPYSQWAEQILRSMEEESNEKLKPDSQQS
jgi:thioredoxin-like negative regulator of GroEL